MSEFHKWLYFIISNKTIFIVIKIIIILYYIINNLKHHNFKSFKMSIMFYFIIYLGEFSLLSPPLRIKDGKLNDLSSSMLHWLILRVSFLFTNSFPHSSWDNGGSFKAERINWIFPSFFFTNSYWKKINELMKHSKCIPKKIQINLK